MSYLTMHSPVGDLTLFEEDQAITVVEWGRVPLVNPHPFSRRLRTSLTPISMASLPSLICPFGQQVQIFKNGFVL